MNHRIQDHNAENTDDDEQLEIMKPTGSGICRFKCDSPDSRVDAKFGEDDEFLGGERGRVVQLVEKCTGNVSLGNDGMAELDAAEENIKKISRNEAKMKKKVSLVRSRAKAAMRSSHYPLEFF